MILFLFILSIIWLVLSAIGYVLVIGQHGYDLATGRINLKTFPIILDVLALAYVIWYVVS